jgi:hypothetical protein
MDVATLLSMAEEVEGGGYLASHPNNLLAFFLDHYLVIRLQCK